MVETEEYVPGGLRMAGSCARRLAFAMGFVALLGCESSVVAEGNQDGDLSSDGGEALPSRDDGGAVDELELEASFWRAVAICGDWVMDASTVQEMAEQADFVVAARLVGVSPGNMIQGDTPEDFYAEVNLELVVREAFLDGPTEGSLTVSLPFARVGRPEDVDAALAEMRDALPQGDIVALLQSRPDFESVYTVMSDKGLWVATTRSLLDNPIASDDCRGHYGDDVRTEFLGTDARTVPELIEQLRSLE